MTKQTLSKSEESSKNIWGIYYLMQTAQNYELPATAAQYAGVNYAEVLYHRGVVDVPLPFIPGIEVSGTIRALGEGVSWLRFGQPVAALTIVLRVIIVIRSNF